MSKKLTFVTSLTSMIMILAPSVVTAALPIRVEITNNAPAGGAFITPVWTGFHDGSFDSYNGGLSSQPGLERIAEDGNTGPISADFLGGYTYVDGSSGTDVSATVMSSQAGSERVDGMVGGAPIAPGQTVSQDFVIDSNGQNRYLSYVSMVLPSNDYFVANGNPMAHDLMSLYGAPVGTSISFDIGLPGTINDAGTEVNFANISGAGDMEDETVAGLGVLGAGYMGQSMPDVGDAENGVVANVADPFGSAMSLLDAHSNLNFNDAGLYPNGLATVTVSVVPEPSSILLSGLGVLGLLAVRRRR